MITKVHQYLLSKLPDKLMKHVLVVESGCWLWQVNINRNGYGRNYENKKRHMVHITFYKFFKGKYANDLLLDHLCCTRNCCNPTHLSPVTQSVNVNRGEAKLFKKKLTYIKHSKNDNFLSDLLEEYCYVW